MLRKSRHKPLNDDAPPLVGWALPTTPADGIDPVSRPRRWVLATFSRGDKEDRSQSADIPHPSPVSIPAPIPPFLDFSLFKKRRGMIRLNRLRVLPRQACRHRRTPTAPGGPGRAGHCPGDRLLGLALEQPESRPEIQSSLPSMHADARRRAQPRLCRRAQGAGQVRDLPLRRAARASVQVDSCTELWTINKERILEKDESAWHDERTQAADRLARRLADEPYDVARELARSKHGTLILISRWQSLGDAVASNQAFDDEQVQMAYDLLAVPKTLRNGSRQVPAASDGPSLAALVKRELAKHQAKLEQTLNRRDELEQDSARLGIVKEYDKETRKLRSDEARAHRRLRWAEATFQGLRQGVDPATVIDPETGRPINPDGHAAAAAAPEPASPAPHRLRLRLRLHRSPHRNLLRVGAAAASGGVFGGRRGDAPRGRRGDRGPVPVARRGDAPERRAGAAARLSEFPETLPPRHRCAPAGPFFADSPDRMTIDAIAGRSESDRPRGSVRFSGALASCDRGGPGRGIVATCEARLSDSFDPRRR